MFSQRKTVESKTASCSDVEVLVCKAVENVQVLLAEKKSAWTDLDKVSFKKLSKSRMSKSKNWRGLV